jgi:hypothetical protein
MHKRKGGWKQKVATIAADEAATMEDEHASGSKGTSWLAAILLNMWAWGVLPAYRLQELAHAAIKDGANHPHLDKLAAIGDHGNYPNKCHQQLMALLVANPMIDNCIGHFTQTFRYWPNPIREIMHHIILPHALFATLFHHYPKAFTARILGGSVERTKAFWQAMRGNPVYEHHPVKLRANHTTHAIPIALFGDGVAVKAIGKTWGDSAEADFLKRSDRSNHISCNMFNVFVF